MKTDDPSYVMKIDTTTGKTVWRVERLTHAVSESPDSYTTPAWIDAGGRAELVITGGDVVSAHDPGDGKEFWRADVLNPQRSRNYRIIASPTIVDGLIIAPTRNNPMVAMRPGGSGDVAASHVAWTFAQGPDVPTPVSDGKLLYIVRDNGVVFALDVKTGADGLRSGTPAVGHLQRVADPRRRQDLRHDRGRRPDDGVSRPGRSSRSCRRTRCSSDCSPYCLSTVAISEGQLFIRTASFLWAIGERRGAQGSRVQ